LIVLVAVPVAVLRCRVQVTLLRDLVHPRPRLIVRRTRASPRRSFSTDPRSSRMAFRRPRCKASTQDIGRVGCGR